MTQHTGNPKAIGKVDQHGINCVLPPGAKSQGAAMKAPRLLAIPHIGAGNKDETAKEKEKRRAHAAVLLCLD